MDKQPPANQSPQPVAYDAQGRPLYAAPPPAQGQEPRVVHMSRAVVPEDPVITPEVKSRHDKSVKAFPRLNLSPAEFVVSAVQRHPIGMAIPMGVTVVVLALIATILFNYQAVVSTVGPAATPPIGLAILIGVLLAILFIVGSYVAIWVYMNNRFYLTNESVIQEIQTSLFAKREQTVSLANVEDASYTQRGIIQMMFNYGSIRLSTQGDETTYRFNYVVNPKKQIALLNNAVEAFKNGRPISSDQLN